MSSSSSCQRESLAHMLQLHLPLNLLGVTLTMKHVFPLQRSFLSLPSLGIERNKRSAYGHAEGEHATLSLPSNFIPFLQLFVLMCLAAVHNLTELFWS